MAGECGDGEEGKREMEDVHELHRSQQGVPEGRIPSTQHRSTGGWSFGAQLNELPGRILRV